jgi:hypothetical protein
MIGIFFVDKLDAKIVDNKAEGDVARAMPLETGGTGCWEVTIRSKVFGEALMGDESGLFEPVHAFSNFDVDPSVGGDYVKQVVLLYDFVGDDADWQSHVFISSHWRV